MTTKAPHPVQLIWASSSVVCADELPPIAQALKTCADELPPIYKYSSSLGNIFYIADVLPLIIALAGGNTSSLLISSSYSSFWAKWASSMSHVAPLYSSPWALMRKWAILYSSSFENMTMYMQMSYPPITQCRENMCSWCSSALIHVAHQWATLEES